MRKKAPLTVERKNGKGGVASEQTPHSSSCLPLAADRSRPFRCSSFSHANRFAGFVWEPFPLIIPLKTTKKGAAAPSLGFSPGFGLCRNYFRLSKTRCRYGFDRPARSSEYSASISDALCNAVRLCATSSAVFAEVRCIDFYTSNIHRAPIFPNSLI